MTCTNTQSFDNIIETATYTVGLPGDNNMSDHIISHEKLIMRMWVVSILHNNLTGTYCPIIVNMISMCIPRVEASMTLDYIKSKLNGLNIGHVRHIREIPLRSDPTHKRILMRFHWNENNNKSTVLQKQMEELGSLKVVYDMPWYWKLVVAQ